MLEKRNTTPCPVCEGEPVKKPLEKLNLLKSWTDPAAPIEIRVETYRCPGCQKVWQREVTEVGMGRFTETWTVVQG